MYRVLLVEDDRGIADALCAQLGDWGFAVRAVENFRDVTGEFRAFDPQLVLLDLMLPGLSGEELLPRLKGIPTIVVSAKVAVQSCGRFPTCRSCSSPRRRTTSTL